MEYTSKYKGAEIDAAIGKVSTLETAVSGQDTKITEQGTKLAEQDAKLTELSERIDNLPKGDKFDKEGNYPSLHVGTADDLAGRGESVPAEFGFRASGGKSIKDGRAYIKRIKGNSVVWNQLSTTTELNESKTTESLPLGASIVQGHKYAIIYESSNARLYFSTKIDGSNKVISSSQDGKSLIFTSDYSATSAGSTNTGLWWIILSLNSATTYSAKNIRLIDLTKAFPNDWQNINTIEEFNARVATLGVDLNAYTEGQVIHCNTESIKSVGDNAWDEEWEDGYYDVNNGQKKPAENLYRSVNHFRILPNNEYYLRGTGIRILYYDANMNYISYEIKSYGIVTSPPNACYASIFGEKIYYSTDIMVTLVHSGWKQDTDAGYQPYWQDTLPLPIIRKYFPDGMKLAGTAHDEIRFNKASGKWEAVQRIGSVDMGTLDWYYAENASIGKLFTGHRISAVNIANRVLHVCAKYTPMKVSTIYAELDIDKIITIEDGFQVRVRDSAYTDAATFKADMADVMLYYELAEPIVTELDAEDQNFRDYYNVADFGTEQSQSSVPSAAFSADIIYQFNAVDMIRVHELEITELQSIIATMQAQLASLASMNGL